MSADLITRWSAKRKAVLVESVLHRKNTRAQSRARAAVLRKHGISAEEFASWEAAYAQWGTPALRATRVQAYRRVSQRRRITNDQRHQGTNGDERIE